MYRFRNPEFRYLLAEANKKLGYEQEEDVDEGINLSWYDKILSHEHAKYSSEKQNSIEESIKESGLEYQKEKELAIKSEFLEIDKAVDDNIEDKYRKIMEDEYLNGIRL